MLLMLENTSYCQQVRNTKRQMGILNNQISAIFELDIHGIEKPGKKGNKGKVRSLTRVIINLFVLLKQIMLPIG